MSKTNSAISGATAGASIGGPWGAAIGGAAGFLMGSDDNSGDYYEQMMREAQNIPLPVLKEYYPELYQQVVSLNPELETAVNLGPSEMQGISTDPRLRQAQLNALSKLEEVGNAGGRDAKFMADMSRLESDINTNNAGNQGAIMQNMAARGVSGGGSELVARNMSAQASSNRQAQMAMDENAQAQQRALDAIMKSGEMGGKMQAQDFSQAAQKAEAADAISRFNAANKQQVITNNTSAKNNAQQWNAQNVQGIADKNTGSRNSAQEYNLGLNQQNYDNQLAKYGLTSGAAKGAADASARQAESQDRFLGGAISAGATAYGASEADKKKKLPGEV